jgi:ubiquinone/menaquinone biosynthesis C-methylase UbiE
VRSQQKQVRDAYDKLAEHYDDAYCTAKDIAENLLVRGHLRRHLDNRHVIDLGCGTGLLLELHKVEPGQYVGLDLSPGMLERARRKFPEHEFRCADMEDEWPVVAGAADSVVSLFGSRR